MYIFILNCWKLGKVTEEEIQAFVEKGFISSDQASQILSV